jgi:hypothetical protein|tara:strand:+ start:798 stop:962 length:165 start_codon:yes stop_codon:yes gene_type:complete
MESLEELIINLTDYKNQENLKDTKAQAIIQNGIDQACAIQNERTEELEKKLGFK